MSFYNVFTGGATPSTYDKGGINTLIFLYLFLVLVVLKLSLNTYNYFRVKKLAKYHMLWLQDKKDNFYTYKSEVLSLFKEAKIKDMMFPASQSVGYGQIANFSASTFGNFPSKRQVIAANVMCMFDDAEGVFRKNIFDALNPLYWIETLIFLPRSLLVYLNLSGEKLSYKLLNIVLSIIWWAAIVLLSLYKTQLKDFIIKLIGEL